MDVEKLFQNFQTHGVCGRWKGEAPGQADVSCSLHYYSAAHQKQSFHRLCAHSTRAAAMGWYQRRGPAPGPGALGCASSCCETFGMGAGCGVRSSCCTRDACLFGSHIILLACCQLLLSISVWVWLGRPSFPRSVPRTDVGSSDIFALACLVAVNYRFQTRLGSGVLVN